MWGFAELAKKAQEQASGLAAGDLFNLDAMQSSKPATGAKDTGKQQTDLTASVATAPTSNQNQSAVKQSFPFPSHVESMTPVVAPVKAPMQPKGKLKIPSKLSTKTSLAKPKAKPAASLVTPSVAVSTVLNVPPGTGTLLASDTPVTEADGTVVATTDGDQVKRGSKKESGTSKETPPNGLDGGKIPKPLFDAADDTSKEKYPVEADRDDKKSVEEAVVENSLQSGPTDQCKKSDADTKTAAPVETSDPNSAEVKKEEAKENDLESRATKEDSIPQPGSDQKAQTEERATAKSGPSAESPGESAAKLDEATETREKPVEESNQLAESKEQLVSKNLDLKATETNGHTVDKPDQAAEKNNEAVEKAEKTDVQVPAPEVESLTSARETADINDVTTNGNEAPPNAVNSSNNRLPAGSLQPESAQPKKQPGSEPVPKASSADSTVDSERVMQQFSAQLQRLQANFEAERMEIHKESRRNVERAVAGKENDIEQLMAKMKEKEIKLRELRRIKEGNELRMDSLKREVEGIKELLEQRDADIVKLKQMGGQDKQQLEQKVRAAEAEHAKTKQELKKIKDELARSKGELSATNDEYTALKSRVKVVAGELKERRAECRDLKNKIEELEALNEKCEDHISSLESQLSDRDRSGTEKDEEVGNLRATIEDLQQKLKVADNNAKTQEDEFEKNLASYKKKAQNSLAVANARAASAAQAKEEAELEARAARHTADATMERARLAEANGQKAMREAKDYYKEMEEAKESAVKELEASKAGLENAKKAISDLNGKLELSASEKARLASEKAQMARDIETERSKTIDLQRDLNEARRRAGSLQKDVAELRSKLQQAESMASANAKNSHVSNAGVEGSSLAPVSENQVEDSNSRATIIMLQNQLKEANEIITELKEALQNAAMSEKSQGSDDEVAAGQGASEKDSVPLFYAMEKQAELNTARNEINRLASLYADVQSEKVEAQEELNATRKELAEEKAKLQRYEKLGSASSQPGTNPGNSDPTSNTSGRETSGSDAGRTNIEYLKNIMLSFLNAKTLAERKALVPVIGAVLCLTAEEQAKAISNVEATGGIEGFSSAFFESIGSRVSRTG